MTRRPCVIGLFAALVLTACSSHRPTYSGTVQTESVAVGSQVGGRIAETEASVGMRVSRGQVLLRLDPALLQAQYDEARAQAGEAAARLSELENGYTSTDVARAREQSEAAQAQYGQAVAQTDPQTQALAAAVNDANAALGLAQNDLDRAQSLAASGDVSRQVLDQAQATYAQAQAKLAQARSTYAAAVNAQLPGQQASARANAAAQSSAYATLRNGPRREEIGQARAQLEAAQSAAAYARARLDEGVVRSPADGVVESFDLHPGDLLNPNQRAAIIDTFADPYAYVYASQRDLGSLEQGTKVRVLSDADGGAYDGVVEAHDRTAQFTPQNVETSDQRAELVYGVKIRIHDPQHRLLDGTTVTVEVP